MVKKVSNNTSYKERKEKERKEKERFFAAIAGNEIYREAQKERKEKKEKERRERYLAALEGREIYREAQRRNSIEDYLIMEKKVFKNTSSFKVNRYMYKNRYEDYDESEEIYLEARRRNNRKDYRCVTCNKTIKQDEKTKHERTLKHVVKD